MELSGSLPTASTYVKGGLPVALDSKRRTIRLRSYIIKTYKCE